jgi:hypothetical protein
LSARVLCACAKSSSASQIIPIAKINAKKFHAEAHAPLSVAAAALLCDKLSEREAMSLSKKFGALQQKFF